MVKIICMKYNIPIQILRPTTTEPYNSDKPIREDDATTFWNLIIALFYKSNHLPWKVRRLMADTCYLGIAFFRDRSDPYSVKDALSQVFSLDTEGYVFKGGKANTDDDKTIHISKEEAVSRIRQAISVYTNSNGHPPQRVVVHKTSRFNHDEKEGFKEGLDGVSKLDLVAFGTRNIKLVRWGEKPPIRGTMVRLPDDSVLLYTTYGFIPYLGVYPGPRVPSPLEILEHFGEASIDEVCEEVLALTKLNWNNAKFCSKAPITIGFARRVGEILRNAPPNSDNDIQNKLKFFI